MFADVVNSTQLIAALDAEQAMDRLQPLVAAMCAAVKRFDGKVVRVLGDGVMAIFGAPLAQEGHALLACEAALAIQAELPPGQQAPTVRVGLHSGPVVLSVLAADPTNEQSAHGLTVHIASRLQATAEPGAIHISEDCYRLVRPYCDVRSLGRQAIRGFPGELEIYDLLGVKPAVASQQFRGTNLTSFHGRSYELGMLQRTLQNAETGDAKVIGVAGFPGSGKSRLCYEFAEWCRSRLIPVLEARAQIYGHATPLQSMLEFLRLMFRISPADDAATARRRIEDRVTRLATTFTADLPLLYDFLGVPDQPISLSQLHANTRHARLLAVVRHIVRQDGAETSVIVIEDLHWLDEASEDFVTTLVESVAGTRTMLVLNYRPSYIASWMKWPSFEQLILAELSAAQIDELVEELMGGRPDLRDTRRQVAQRSGGNPFFAEELVRSLAENGIVCGDPGDYSLGSAISDATLPATLEAVVGERIDRLAETDKFALQIASIIGTEFPLIVLREVLGVAATGIDASLARLCEAELIQEQTSTERRQFAFRHPVIQEVAYSSQLMARRAPLHARVAKAMTQFFSDRLNEFAALIAYHYEAAGQPLDAAHYEAQAALWVGSTSPSQAIKHWKKVRLLLHGQERNNANDVQRIMASSQIAWLGWREGMTAETAKPFVEEALAWAYETDDSMVPLLLFVDARIAAASGGPADSYVERVKGTLSSLKGTMSAGRVATLNCALSQAYGWAGLLREALVANDAAMLGIHDTEKFDDQFLGYSVEHWTIGLRGRILLRLGRFDEGKHYLDTLLQIERTLFDPAVQFIPHLGYVDLAWCLGDSELAQKHAARVAEIAKKGGTPYLKVYAFACAGTAQSIAGDLANAAQSFTDGLHFVQQATAAMAYEPEMLASLADCYRQMGDAERAIATARSAIQLAQARNARLAECRASITCGAALLAKHSGSTAVEAIELFDRAEDLIQISGATIYEPLLWHARSPAAIVAA